MISNRRRAASTRRCPGSPASGSAATGSPATGSPAKGSSGTGSRRRRAPGPGTRAGSTPESPESAAAEPGPAPEADSAANSSAAAASASARSAAAAAVSEESRRSQRGMSTPAQMTTIATYRIALLNNPPLAERAGSRARCHRHSAPVAPAYVTQSNSWRNHTRAPHPVCREKARKRDSETARKKEREQRESEKANNLRRALTVTPGPCSATAASAPAAIPRPSARNKRGLARPR